MVQVKISEGLIEGEVLEGSLGGSYYSFKGIPYAKPPIGDLRFKAPQPPKPWSGIRSAIEHGPVCCQYDMFTQSIIEGSEDCLYINVYTPEITPKEPLPVMVWIHGGGFMSGTGNSEFYGPDFLMPQGVILVTFNYRLEVLGFLCLDTEDVPGNAGMKDQVAALRWVKRNIYSFGGNPDNVTIFGESAGSGSVSYHVVSPMSKGLFKRAIMQSGVSLSQWALAFEPRQRAISLARQLGFKSEDDKELYNFFKKLPTDKLIFIRTPITLTESVQPNVNLQFTVCNEKQFGNNERFFYGDIYEQLQNGIHEGVEVLIGYVADEGYLNLGLNPLTDILLKFNTYVELFCPLSLTYNLPIAQQMEIGRVIRQYYYGKVWDIKKENIRPLESFFSFNTFIFDTMQWVKLCAKKQANDVYLYKFAFASERNVMVNVIGARDAVIDADKPIVCHVDDLMYLFDIKLADVPVNKESKSYQMIKTMTTLWTNFARYGNPTPDDTLGVKWTPYTLEGQDYLHIGNELKPERSPDKTELELWESIFQKYYPKRLAIKKLHRHNNVEVITDV